MLFLGKAMQIYANIGNFQVLDEKKKGSTSGGIDLEIVNNGEDSLMLRLPSPLFDPVTMDVRVPQYSDG